MFKDLIHVQTVGLHCLPFQHYIPYITHIRELSGRVLDS